MANILKTEKQVAVIGALSEDMSNRSVERMTGVHRDTIMRLGVKVGNACTATATAFVADLVSRLKNRVLLSTDGLNANIDAIERGFGANVHYCQIVKSCSATEMADRMIS